MSNMVKEIASNVIAGAVVGGLAFALAPSSANASEGQKRINGDTSADSSGSLERRQNERRLAINKTGMLTLLGWSVGNIAVGAYGSSTTTGETKYFHQMNLMWNTVNAAIAGFGYYGAATEDVSGLNAIETIEETRKMQQILIFNAGLDIAYIAAGAGLRALGDEKSDEQYIGYGNSVMLQGGFLFAFDAVLWAFHENAISDYKVELMPGPTDGPGASLSIRF
jgi:hypothetical protein